MLEALPDDLRHLVRLHPERPAAPSTVSLDSRPRKGRKIRVAVHTLGHLLAALNTPANEQDRAPVGARAQEGQTRNC